jgi:hypothetical protein
MVKEQALNEWLSAARNAEDRGQQFVDGRKQRDFRPFPCPLAAADSKHAAMYRRE